MRKGKMVLEQPIVWLLIIIAGLLVAYGLYRMLKLAAERGLPAIFGG